MKSTRSEAFPIRRREAAAALLADRGDDLLVVGGLGSPNWDITAAGDSPMNFPLWGAMGAAAMIGLGLALAQPHKRVLVVTGDGEMLMSLGALATIASMRPANLTVAVFDNERYGETGMQDTATAHGADLTAIAQGAGIASADTILEPGKLALVKQAIATGAGPHFFTIKVRAEPLPFVMPPKDGAYLKDRFRLAVLGAAANA